MTEITGYIDLGIRIQVDEQTTYHGNAWHKDNGEVHCCIGPETSYTLMPDGECRIWHNGEKAW